MPFPFIKRKIMCGSLMKRKGRSAHFLLIMKGKEDSASITILFQNNFSHNNYLSKIIIKCGKLLRE